MSLYKIDLKAGVGVWKMTETPTQLLAMLHHKEWYNQALKNYKKTFRQREWLACRVLLCQLLGEEKQIAYKPSGAPYLIDQSAQISFSHTKDYVAIQVTPPDQIAGVDIETIAPRIKKVVDHFLSAEEQRFLCVSDHETEPLLIAWCAKETLIKMIDQKAIDITKHLTIQPFKLCPTGLLTASVQNNTVQDFLLHYEIDQDYVLVYHDSI